MSVLVHYWLSLTNVLASYWLSLTNVLASYWLSMIVYKLSIVCAHVLASFFVFAASFITVVETKRNFLQIMRSC